MLLLLLRNAMLNCLFGVFCLLASYFVVLFTNTLTLQILCHAELVDNGLQYSVVKNNKIKPRQQPQQKKFYPLLSTKFDTS